MGGLLKSVTRIFSTGKSAAKRYENDMKLQLEQQQRAEREQKQLYEQRRQESEAQFALLEAEQQARISEMQAHMESVRQQNLTLQELEGQPQDVLEVVPGGEASREDTRQRRRRAPLDLGSILGIL